MPAPAITCLLVFAALLAAISAVAAVCVAGAAVVIQFVLPMLDA